MAGQNLVFRVNGRVAERLVYWAKSRYLRRSKPVGPTDSTRMEVFCGLRQRPTASASPTFLIPISPLAPLRSKCCLISLRRDAPARQPTIMAGLLIKELLIRGDLERCLIVAPQTTVYGTLATWARQLGLHDDARVLHAILEQEKAADEKLSRLAEQGVNQEAAEREPRQSPSERGQMAGYYDDAAHYVQTGTRAVVHQVEEQPLTAMLIAGATGYLLAYLIHGEHSSWSEEQLPGYARRR